MRGQIQITVFIMVLILFSCTESADQEFEGFTEKQAQEVSERTVSDLTVVDSLNISKAFNPFSISNIRLSKKAIFGKLGNQVVKLDKQNLSEIGKYTIPQGRGPGEIVDFDLTWLGAGDETFSLYDSKAKKNGFI